MKYKNKQQFIKSCNEDKDSVGREITELDLKRYNILPDFEGKYSGAQKFILCSKIRKEEGYEPFDKESLAKTSSLRSQLKESINSGEIQKFLLIYLSEKFQEDVKCLREAFEIPQDGFGPEDDKKCAEWFLERKREIMSYRGLRTYNNVSDDPKTIKEREEFYRALEFRHKAYLDTLVLTHYGNKIKNYKFEVKKPFLSFDVPETPIFVDGMGLFQKYKLNIMKLGSLLPASIIIFDLWKPIFNPFYDYSENFSPISCIESSDQLKIIISEPITKRALISHIDENWPEMKVSLDKMFKPVRINKNSMRNFLTVQLKKQGKNSKEIKNILKEYSLTPSQIKKIIGRTKKRVEGLEPEI